MAEHKHDKVTRRDDIFADKVSTKISCEVPSNDNPFLAERMLCHGYDVSDLMENCSFVSTFFLLFRGELPDKNQEQLLQTLMIALINPGPRHPATKAAMNVGVGKTNPAHILPIASSVLSGEHQGGADIESCMRFLRKNSRKHPREVCATLIAEIESSDTKIAGFGCLYGSIDKRAEKYALTLANIAGESSLVHWGCEFAKCLGDINQGWLMQGVAAAVLADLGFQPRAGICLFQLLSSPGLVAHGLELANKPITAMPHVSDENYVIK